MYAVVLQPELWNYILYFLKILFKKFTSGAKSPCSPVHYSITKELELKPASYWCTNLIDLTNSRHSSWFWLLFGLARLTMMCHTAQNILLLRWLQRLSMSGKKQGKRYKYKHPKKQVVYLKVYFLYLSSRGKIVPQMIEDLIFEKWTNITFQL